MPIQSRREATFSWVIRGGGLEVWRVEVVGDDDEVEGGEVSSVWNGSRTGDIAVGAGGSGPPMVTLPT